MHPEPRPSPWQPAPSPWKPAPSPWQPAPSPDPGPPAPSTVVVQPGGGADWLYRHLLDRRIVLARGLLDHDAATLLCAQLLTLDAEGDTPIELHMSTPDGEPDAALTVLDALDALRAPVHALAVGEVGGPAVAVYAAAPTRLAFPHARFHLTEPRLHATGPATEIAAVQAHQQALTEALFARITAAVTTGDVREDARSGRYFTAAEAHAMGLVTQIRGER